MTDSTSFPLVGLRPEEVKPSSAERSAEADGALTSRLSLPSGRSIVAHGGREEALVVQSPTGDIEVSIRFEAAGPVVRISAGAIHLSSHSSIDVECETFRVRARHGIDLETQGDLQQTVGGDQSVTVVGSSSLQAEHVDVSARGDLKAEAAGDARLNGGRVLINS